MSSAKEQAYRNRGSSRTTKDEGAVTKMATSKVAGRASGANSHNSVQPKVTTTAGA